MSQHSSSFREVHLRSIERLETRSLFATTGTFVLATGALTITGDANSNIIVIDCVFAGGTWQVAVEDNSNPVFIAGGPVRTVDVKSISVDGKEADDSIDLNQVDAAFGWGAVFPLDGAVTLIGSSGWDTINGSTFRDSVIGNDGKDTLNGYFGADTVVGGLDADLVSEPADVASDLIYGGERAVNDLADASDDFLNGGAGNDTFYGGAGADAIYGDDGADILWGENGNDYMWGGSENDTLSGGDGNDELFGEAGVDVLWGEASGWASSVTGSNDSLSGGADNDTLDGQFGNDFLAGDEVDPAWIPFELATDGEDSLYGGDGSASFSLAGGNDSLYGGGKKDKLKGMDGNDKLYGGTTEDWLYGGDGGDLMVGDGGNDTMYGENGRDSMMGSEGCDTMDGGSSGDQMGGNYGDDMILTGAGEPPPLDDYAIGHSGKDTIDGVVDEEASEGCHPQMLMGGSPEIQAEKGVIAFEDQRIEIAALETLGRDDRRVYLRSRSFTNENIEVVERLLREFAAGRSGAAMTDGDVDADAIAGFTTAMVVSSEPRIENERTVLRNQRNDLVFLEMLGREDRRTQLRSRNFTHADIDVVERLLAEFRAQRG